MRIEAEDEDLIRVYRCGHCRGAFRLLMGRVRTSCLVLHSPGSCCHHGETEVTQAAVDAALRALKTA